MLVVSQVDKCSLIPAKTHRLCFSSTFKSDNKDTLQAYRAGNQFSVKKKKKSEKTSFNLNLSWEVNKTALFLWRKKSSSKTVQSYKSESVNMLCSGRGKGGGALEMMKSPTIFFFLSPSLLRCSGSLAHVRTVRPSAESVLGSCRPTSEAPPFCVFINVSACPRVFQDEEGKAVNKCT